MEIATTVFRLAACAAALSLVGCGSSRAQWSAPSEPVRVMPLPLARAEMYARRASLRAAIVSRDAGRLSALFTESSQLVVVSDTLRGRDAILSFFERMDRGRDSLSLTLSREDDVGVCWNGDGFERGVFALRATGPAGLPSEARGRFAILWTRTGADSLRIARAELSYHAVARRVDFERCSPRVFTFNVAETQPMQISLYNNVLLYARGGGVYGLEKVLRSMGWGDPRVTECTMDPRTLTKSCRFENTPRRSGPSATVVLSGATARRRMGWGAAELSARFAARERIDGHDASTGQHVRIDRSATYVGALFSRVTTYWAAGVGPSFLAQRTSVFAGDRNTLEAGTRAGTDQRRLDRTLKAGGSGFVELRLPIDERLVVDFRIQRWVFSGSPVPPVGSFPGLTATNSQMSNAFGLGYRF